MSNLDDLVKQQNEKIAQLTEMLGAFLSSPAPAQSLKNTNEGGIMPRKLKYGQGSVRKRQRTNKNGKIYEWYEAQWLDEYGKKLYSTATTQEAAYKILSQSNPRTLKNKRKNLKTFGEYFLEWYNAFGNAECGEKRNASNLTQITRIPKNIMSRPLMAITALELQTYLNSIDKAHPKIQIKQLTRACLKYAFTNGHIKINIGDSLKADIPVVTEKQILPRELEDKFISLFPEEYREYVIGLIYTGTRISEFFDLNKHWETDIDYEKKVVKIRETKSLRQKDIKAGITFVYRELPLLDPVAKIKFPLKTIQQQTINKNFNKVLKKMNVEDPNLNLKVTPHCMRHTFITRCDELGINETASMGWTGHKTTKMHRRYKHKTTQIVTEATEKLMNSTVIRTVIRSEEERN